MWQKLSLRARLNMLLALILALGLAINIGRLVLGAASGDRPFEFPAFGRDIEARGEHFRESLAYMLAALREDSPGVESTRGVLHGAEHCSNAAL